METRMSPEKISFSKRFWEYGIGVTINRFTEQLGMFDDRHPGFIDNVRIICGLDPFWKRDPIIKALEELAPIIGRTKETNLKS